MSLEDFSGEPVLFSSFTVLNEVYRVYFNRGSLIWALENAVPENKVVSIRDIISIDYVHDRVCSCKTVAYAGKYAFTSLASLYYVSLLMQETAI